MNEMMEFAKENPFVTLLIVIVVVNGIVSIFRTAMSNPENDSEKDKNKNG